MEGKDSQEALVNEGSQGMDGIVDFEVNAVQTTETGVEPTQEDDEYLAGEETTKP